MSLDNRNSVRSRGRFEGHNVRDLMQPSVRDTFRAADAHRTDYESIWRIADKPERVARDQGQRRLIGRIEQAHLTWRHDADRRHLVPPSPFRRVQQDLVPNLHLPQGTEEGVPMAGNPDVAGLAWARRVFDVARAAPQRAVVSAFEDDC